jgi:hypothetical protein
MTGRVAQLQPLVNATTQLSIASATESTTPTGAGKQYSPMTGRELRAQLRAQQYRNSPPQQRNSAAEEVASVAEQDDRRPCTDCANLTARDMRCLAAWRGERPGNAARDYHPVTDLPRCCECYEPKATEPDRRNGADRWPYLLTALPPSRDTCAGY